MFNLLLSPVQLLELAQLLIFQILLFHLSYFSFKHVKELKLHAQGVSQITFAQEKSAHAKRD